jgi:heptosyltransferase-3
VPVGWDGHKLLIVGEESDHDTLVALSMATPRATIMERQLEPDAVTGEQTDYLDIYAALRHAALFVGNDEIWLSLAAAAGVPSFGLYGPSDEAHAATGVHPLRGPRSFDDIHAVDPKLKSTGCHMLDLSIDKVYDGVELNTRSLKT